MICYILCIKQLFMKGRQSPWYMGRKIYYNLEQIKADDNILSFKQSSYRPFSLDDFLN